MAEPPAGHYRAMDAADTPHLVALREDDPSHRATYIGICNAIWPEFSQTDAEFLHEVRLGGAARRWLVHDGAAPDAPAIGALSVERVRWNDDGAPPLSFVLLPVERQAPGTYRALLRPLARFAVDEGFDELRLLAWDRDAMLIDVATAMPGWGEVERDVDVGLDLTRDDLAFAPEVPAGIELTTLAARPELAASAHACLVAAVADIPGDEREQVPDFDAWMFERDGPTSRDEATFVAVDADQVVVGYAALEFLELLDDLAWNGYTAVHPAARGRGIALALKAATIDYARAAGFRQLRTENEARNAPMRHINQRIGYEPVAWRVVLRGPVAPVLDPS